MSGVNRPSKSARARAAVDEVDGSARGTKTVTFFDATYTLPDRLPGSLLWDFGDMESDGAGATMKVLESCLGREQYLDARQQVISHDVAFDEVEEKISDLLSRIFDAYGVRLGE